MYDSVTAGDIPAAADLVAGYVDGAYAWSDQDWARFPRARHVLIAVSPATNRGHVLDVEQGDATPAEAVDWVLMRRAAGADPTVYMSQAVWLTVRQAFAARQVREPHYWVANYDGQAGLPLAPLSSTTTAVAKQYRCGDPGCGAYAGGHFDISAVADHWPGVDPIPVPVPVFEEEDMRIVNSPSGQGQFLASGGRLSLIGTPADVQELRDAGVVFLFPDEQLIIAAPAGGGIWLLAAGCLFHIHAQADVQRLQEAGVKTVSPSMQWWAQLKTLPQVA